MIAFFIQNNNIPIIKAIQKKLKCDKLEASEIFKENAKRGDYT